MPRNFGAFLFEITADSQILKNKEEKLICESAVNNNITKQLQQ